MDGEITPDVLRAALEDANDAEDLCIVDIRNPGQFVEGHIPGSENVPLAELPGSIDRIAAADHVVTVCPHGKASIKAARIVGAYQGFDGTVESLRGGLEAWEGPVDVGEGDDAEADAAAAETTAADEGPDAPF